MIGSGILYVVGANTIPFHTNHTPTTHDVCFPRIHGKGMNHVWTLQHVTLWGCQGTLLLSLRGSALSRHVEHNPLCKIKWLAPAPNTELVISLAGLVIM